MNLQFLIVKTHAEILRIVNYVLVYFMYINKVRKRVFLRKWILITYFQVDK